MKKENRIDYLTTAKGILIILVVLGHSNVPFRNFIYLFHVAAFFFISGIFYKNNYTEKPFLFIYKKLKSLYIPFILYSTIFILLHNFFVNTQIYSSIYGTNNERNYIYGYNEYVTVFKNVFTFGSTEQLLVSMWFLTVLFTIFLIMIILDSMLNKLETRTKSYLFPIIVTTMFTIGMLLTYFKVELPRFLNVSLVTLGIFYAGFRLKEVLSSITFNLTGAICCFVILILNSYYGNQELVTNRYPNPAFFILNSFLGIYLTIYLAQLATKSFYINKFLTYSGENSIHILALHCLAFKLASFIIILTYNYPIDWLGKFFTIREKVEWWPLYGIIGIVIPLICVFIFQNTYTFFNSYLVPENNEKRKSH